jgi:hypothetical protein
MAKKKDVLALIKAAVPVGEAHGLRELATQLRTSMKAVIDEVEGSYAGLDLLVGVRSNAGVASLPRRDWQVEHYQA